MRERVPFIVVASVLAVGTIAFVSPSPADPRPRETPAAGEAAAALPLTEAPVWTVESDDEAAVLGRSVASAGDVNDDGFADVIVGAQLYGGLDAGRAFVYMGSPAGLDPDHSWIAAGDNERAWLGISVDGAGDVNGDGYDDVIVGGHGYDGPVTDQGRAAVYIGSSSGLGTVPDWVADGGQERAFLGVSVAGAGDVNGDGYDDVIVGAYKHDTNPDPLDPEAGNEGRADLYLGSGSGLEEEPAWSRDGEQVGAWFGFSVAAAGDVNDDGYDDVLVGAIAHDREPDNPALGDEGRVYLFLGSSAGLAEDPVWTEDGDQSGALLGSRVSGAGDVNNDGYDDILVAAPRYDTVQDPDPTIGDQGRAFLYLGAPTGVNTTPNWFGQSDQDDALFGLSMAAAGDVNLDGYGDIIVGVPQHDVFTTGGRAEVFLGSAGGILPALAWSAIGEHPGAFFGGAVAGAGDLNGDGVDDVIVGAQATTRVEEREGVAYAYHGIPALLVRLDILLTGAGAGIVTSFPIGIQCDPVCDAVFTEETAVTLTADPSPGSTFGGWAGDPDCGDGLVALTGDTACTSIFNVEGLPCTDADGDGSGNPGSSLCPRGALQDCDDGDDTIYPGAPEACDGRDNSCNLSVDQVDCNLFDVNGDGVIQGAELSWLGGAFGLSSGDPENEWWYLIDYTEDGQVDGEDLTVLGVVWFCEGTRNVCQ